MRARLLALLLLLAPVAFAQGRCARVSLEGEVEAGHGFEREIGGGLKAGLDPVASGWIVRVVPVRGPRGAHDDAALATPPYGSVNPLLVTTDYGFRAQDVIGWNPRRFHFAADAASFAALARAYDKGVTQGQPEAQAELARLASESPEGTMTMLDARLVPGRGDQVPAAGAVASHFDSTAHTLEQGEARDATGRGRVLWMRFRLALDLPSGFRVAPGMKAQFVPCGVHRPTQ